MTAEARVEVRIALGTAEQQPAQRAPVADPARLDQHLSGGKAVRVGIAQLAGERFAKVLVVVARDVVVRVAAELVVDAEVVVLDAVHDGAERVLLSEAEELLGSITPRADLWGALQPA